MSIAAKHPVEEEDDLDAQKDKYLTFHIASEDYGIAIVHVTEIIGMQRITQVPKTPAFIKGVINLRGSVLPVIDLRLRLGLPRVERSDRQRIMVFLIAEVRTGFIVDQVTEVLKIAKSVIEPSPQLSNQEGKLLARMANMEKQKRMVQLLDPAYLVEGDELKNLAAVRA